MTILEDDETPVRNKLSLSKAYIESKNFTKETGQVKRKQFNEHSFPNKKLVNYTERRMMLNGYRTDHHRNSNDVINECPVAPLANMGNTCFLNSVIYTLRFAPTFLHNLHHLIDDLAKVNSRLTQNKIKSSSLGRSAGLISGPSSRSTSSKDLLSLGSVNDVSKSKVQIVTEKFHELFMTLHNLEENRKKEPNDAYQPVAFLQAVREANYIFEGNHQQDAHELLVYLLDNIRETCDLLAQQIQHYPEIMAQNEMPIPTSNTKIWDMKRRWIKSQKKKDKTKDAISEEQSNGTCVTDTEDASSVDGTSDNGKKKLGYNFVAEDFEGITLRRTKCLECESVTERKEPFYDIPVPISLLTEDDFDKNPCEIYRRACVTSEKLCDSNKYLCEKCKRYNEASREVSFEKLPNIMVLQLKRFTTTAAGVQKVNTYMPTPLEMTCFCDSCCQTSDNLHRYQLCCVIMHLGGTLASGHYIAYVRATDQFDDYADCPRDVPKGSLSASSSEKSLNILKYFKSKGVDAKNGVPVSKNSAINGVRLCKSKNCCGIKMNRNIVENVVNNYMRRNGGEVWNGDYQQDMWLECDDENVRPVTSQEFQDLLGSKQNSTSTPYLLFYTKMSDVVLDE
ncbi:ubiquitin carboxyl-terminal hydrolase [Holotrichia oblita]|uniref:Ubiquitin carboxyl-terminal hydrolase n=3 Tax=Holotrichia oblita TaxID=644536 RepID=A0ACB9SZ47_HOLOL|nr:ubiquitin carboxyl-terminal hydrolase [Holotrichia oblita]KAI4459784.1 ubiquitin carboxyl-terminal hydrolase [Holotrichia oblita]